MDPKFEKKSSKFLSLILRHKPETIGISLSPDGWAEVDSLLQQMNSKGHSLSFDQLRYIVETNDKQRFSFNENHTRIRANQGHSIEVDLALQPLVPPSVLYHGTATRFIDSIKKEGLKRLNRQHVHLSSSMETASLVGQRHGKLALLTIDAKRMHEDKLVFFLSKNGVWLTEHVPVKYIDFQSQTNKSS